MTRLTMLLRLVCMLGVLFVLAGASRATGSPPQSSQRAKAAPEGLTATVHALDTNAHTLEVITGVGHAVRLMRVQVDPGCQIRVAGAAAQLGDLKAGKIVRIQYRKTHAGAMAEKIQTVAVGAREGKR